MSSSLTGLFIILGVLVIYSISLVCQKGKKYTDLFYEKKSAKNLRYQIANSIEEGAMVHCDICNLEGAGFFSEGTLTALHTTQKLSNQLSSADEPLLLTSNDSALTFFGKEAINQGLKKSGLENEFDPNQSIFAGYSPLSHQAGIIGILDGEASAFHLNIGAFGPEIALQDSAFDSSEGIIAAGDNLAAQAVSYVTADDVFIGEEIFELPQVIQEKPEMDSGLIAMDIIRFGIIIALISGAVLTFLF